MNPQGCQVFSFKHPSTGELDHDVPWRTHRALPERGRIGSFNRSCYEELLIVRVPPEILRAQELPDSAFVSRIVLRTIEGLALSDPRLDEVRRERLQELRRRLKQEAGSSEGREEQTP